MIWISCFSPPEGYLVGNGTTSRSVPAAARIAAIASGLLSSIAISVSPASSSHAMMRAPATTSAARSRISTSSAVM